MSEMIERVARAIGKTIVQQKPGFSGLSDYDKADEIENSWRDWLPEARAAIEAMRIPTDGMITAADCLDVINKGVLITPTPIAAWDAMIDAALKPEVQP